MNTVNQFEHAKYCSYCGKVFDRQTQLKFCPVDDERLLTVENPFSGKKFGRLFQVQELLGCGTFGLVFKAKQISLNRTVAIKLLHRHMVGRTDVTNRFMREAALISQLNHPNITSVIDYGLLGTGEPYLIMEFLEGVNLGRIMREKGRLTWEESYPIVRQICDGLTAAHAQHIVHRDIKPSNIHVISSNAPGETVKLLDFGLARLVNDSMTGFKKMTESGLAIGTPTYMSPEACMGKRVDERSDIYSLGCLIYEMLTGSVAMAGGNVLETMNKHVSEYPASFESHGVVIPNAVQNIVRKALEKEPKRRFQTVAELKEQLDRFAQKSAAAENDRTPGALFFPLVVAVCEFVASVMRHRKHFPAEYNGMAASIDLAAKGTSCLVQNFKSSAGGANHQARQSVLAMYSEVVGFPALLACGVYSRENIFELLPLVESLSIRYRQMAEDKNISFMTYVSTRIPSLARGNATCIRRVITQLIDNAFASTESGSISVTAVPESFVDDQFTVRISVADTGTGSANRNLNELFQPFSQLNSKSKQPGTGLCISKHLVEAMGGEMRVDSTENGGASFSFTLNLSQVAFTQSVRTPNLPMRGVRLLLVNNEPNVGYVVNAYLHDAGMVCDMVTSPIKALDAMRLQAAADTPYPIVVLHGDLDSEATEFAQAINSDSTLSSTKLVLLAKHTPAGEGPPPGFSACLSKPMTWVEFLDCLLLVQSNAAISPASEVAGRPQSYVRESSLVRSMPDEFAIDNGDAEALEGADETPAAFPIHCIDLFFLRQTYGKEVAEELVATFVSGADRLLSHILATIEKKQPNALELLARQLYDSATAIRASEVMRLAAILEKAAAKSDLDEASITADRLKGSFTRVEQYMETAKTLS